MRRTSNVLGVALALAVAWGSVGLAETAPSPRDLMREFVRALSQRARAAAPGFLIVPQNGLELLTFDGRPDGDVAEDYVLCIDGVGQEDLTYGYTADEVPTPEEDHLRLLSFLDRARSCGKAVLVIDYCAEPSNIAAARAVCRDHAFAGYAAPSRDLDVIASDRLQPYDATSNAVTNLASARSALYLLNPERYVPRADFVAAIAATDYDIVIVDAWTSAEESLTATDVAALSHKSSGARRVVLAYLSVGEAEDYRGDWNPAWAADLPPWLGEENPHWPGNYTVDYWAPAWQSIVFARLDAMVRVGFDGVYLDKVDAFASFESGS